MLPGSARAQSATTARYSIRAAHRGFGLVTASVRALSGRFALPNGPLDDFAAKLRGNIVHNLGMNYTAEEGEAAFYGPKVDFIAKDAIGREWQVATIQVDLTMLPERFQLEFIDTDGQPKRPVVIHRAIFGSYERFIGIITEHYAGAFPTWLAPVQARVLPVSEKFIDYARAVHRRLRDARIRAELDDRNEKLGYRIRDAQVRKVPYMLVVGGREAEQGTVSLRPRTGEDRGAVALDRVVADLTAEIAARAADLTVGRS